MPQTLGYRYLGYVRAQFPNALSLIAYLRHTKAPIRGGIVRGGVPVKTITVRHEAPSLMGRVGRVGRVGR